MAKYPGRLQFQITDINGDVALCSIPFYVADTTTLADLAADLAIFEPLVAALTNGKVTRQSVSMLVNEAQFLVGTAPPNNAEYSSVTDGARLNFADGSGERMSVTIPAPIEAAFGASSNVVDSTQANVAAFIAAVEANTNTRGGSSFNLYKGGSKVGRGTRRRATRLVP